METITVKIQTNSGGTAMVSFNSEVMKIDFPGTACYKDVITDLLWPFCEEGFAKGPLIQSEEIYNKIEGNTAIPPIYRFKKIWLSGHSLGAGVMQCYLHRIQKENPNVFVYFKAIGGLSSLSRVRSKEIENNPRISGNWSVAHRDPVAVLSKIFRKPSGNVTYCGKERKWFLDFDFDLTKTHVEAYR